MSGLYKRHGLVWLTERGWHAVAALPEHRHIVERWQAQDWPAVIRRRDADCPAQQICLGIALPPDAGGVKLRLPLRVDSSEVRALRAPLEISQVVSHAAPSWQAGLSDLQNEVMVQNLSIRVFGSLALQALTGQTYLRPSSDIDVLFRPGDRQQLQQGMQLLTRYATLLPLDGEVEFPGGAAVAWKEWAQACSCPDSRVLAKRSSDVALLRVGDMIALLETHACLA